MSHREQADSTNESKRFWEEVDEYELFGPGIIALKDRQIFFRNLLDSEEHEEYLRDLVGNLDRIKDNIKSQIKELENILQKYPPLEIMGIIAWRNLIIDPETYKEFESDKLPVFIEYVSQLLLLDSYDTYPQISTGPIPQDVIEDIHERTKGIFSNYALYLGFKEIDPGDREPDPLIQIRFQVLVHSLYVRGMIYLHHLVELIEDLFGPLSDAIEEVLGFNAYDLIQIAGGIEDIATEKFNSRQKKAHNFESNLRRAVKKYRRKGKVSEEFDEELLRSLASKKPSNSANEIRNIAMSWFVFGLGETLTFTKDEIVSITNLDEERIERFLEYFSLRFGEISSKYFRFPSPTPPLRTKPVICVDGERYFVPVILNLYWGLRQRLEELLNPDSQSAINRDHKVWEQYERRRADYLENMSIHFLNKGLKFSESFKSLRYSFREDGEEIEGELDGLLLLDDVIFLVEAKSGGLSPPARRGAPKRIQEELEKLVEEAYGQALRAKRYISNVKTPKFATAKGEMIEIDMSQYKRVFMVTVTLENLSAFVTNLYQLEDLGFVSKNEYPWAVSLSDLRVISEIVETSAEFIHYLTRRIRINELEKIKAEDELDWFGHYIQKGLYFEGDPRIQERESRLNLLSYTTPFDEYYMYETGQRKTPTEKPRQPMPEIMESILAYLENTHQPGYLKAATALLDMGSDSRNDFAKHFDEARRLTVCDGRIHDFSMVFLEGGFGITCMFAPVNRFGKLYQRLQQYCYLKKYQNKVSIWVGFGCIPQAEEALSMFYIHDSPIEHSRRMDRLISKLPSSSKDI